MAVDGGAPGPAAAEAPTPAPPVYGPAPEAPAPAPKFPKPGSAEARGEFPDAHEEKGCARCNPDLTRPTCCMRCYMAAEEEYREALVMEREDRVRPPCHKCGKGMRRTFLCGRCREAQYCSEECQKAAWKHGHRKACHPPKPYGPFFKEGCGGETAEKQLLDKRAAKAARPPQSRWVPGEPAPPEKVHMPETAFVATFLSKGDLGDVPLRVSDPYTEWDLRTPDRQAETMKLDEVFGPCPYAWPERDAAFARCGDRRGVRVFDSREFEPTSLVVHVAQFRWCLKSDAEAAFYWDSTLRRRTEEDNDGGFVCERLADGRGVPLDLLDADESILLRSKIHENGCVAWNFLFRLGRLCAKTFLVSYAPPYCSLDAIQVHALQLADVAVSRCRIALDLTAHVVKDEPPAEGAPAKDAPPAEEAA